MLETINENNWHEFLNSSIEGTLQGAARIDNQWIKNIFRNLDSCFKEYWEVFEDIAQALLKARYKELQELTISGLKISSEI